jgi:succinate dehydrogenase hydrophobic anchor subunit
MKHVSLVILLLSAILFLVATYSKFAGHDGWILGFAPQSWWRVSLWLAVFAIGAKMVCPFTKSHE